MGTITRVATAIALAAAATPVVAQGTFAEHPLLTGFERITTGESGVLSNPMDMLVPYWSLAPTFEGRQGIEISLYREGDVAVAELTKTGLFDDAVAAERYRGVSTPTAGGWLHGEVGRQVKCRRGPTRDEWTTGPCP